MISEGNELLMNSVKLDAETSKLIEKIDDLKLQMVLYAHPGNKEFIKNGKLENNKFIYNSESRVGHQLTFGNKFSEFMEDYK